MRLKINKHRAQKDVARLKKKLRIRRKVHGTSERPRLCVFRSARHMYAQIIDDLTGQTLASASTLEMEGMKHSNLKTAAAVGQEIAKKALEKNIKTIVFDRNGYLYHGRIQALADAVREAGLTF